MDQVTKTLTNIAMDAKIEEKMEKNGEVVFGVHLEKSKETRELLKRTFGLENLLVMPIAEIVEALRMNPQRAKEIYHV